MFGLHKICNQRSTLFHLGYFHQSIMWRVWCASHNHIITHSLLHPCRASSCCGIRCHQFWQRKSSEWMKSHMDHKTKGWVSSLLKSSALASFAIKTWCSSLAKGSLNKLLFDEPKSTMLDRGHRFHINQRRHYWALLPAWGNGIRWLFTEKSLCTCKHF